MRAGIGRLVRLLVSITAAVAVALVLLEILLRVGLYEALPIPIEAPIFAMPLPGRLRLRPDVDARSRGGEWDVRYVTNAEGLRDGDHEGRALYAWQNEMAHSADSRPLSILGVGDSFTFGWGVPFDAIYLLQAERALMDETRRPAEIYSAAVPGWGPSDELDWLRENWDRWKPNLVLLGFVAGNDFFDTMMGGARQYDVIEGIQVPKDRNRSGLSSVKAFLRRRSALYRAVAAITPGLGMRLAERRGRVMHWPVNDVYLRDAPPATRAAFDSTLRVLDEMLAFATARGAAFAVVVIPGRAQVHAEDFARFKSRFGFAEADLDMDAPQRAVDAWAAERGVPILDLAPPFRAAAASDTTRLYFRGDSHWTPAGHALAGRLVARFLIDKGLVAAGGAAAPATAAAGSTAPGSASTGGR